MRTLIRLLLLALVAAPATAGPRVWQARDVAITEGEVEVNARPAVVYRALTDYARWPALFSDIMWAAVKSGGREKAVIFLAEHSPHKLLSQAPVRAILMPRITDHEEVRIEPAPASSARPRRAGPARPTRP